MVATVTATDADYGTEGDVTYSMATHSKFLLDSITGEVSVKAQLEGQTSYSLSITASDGTNTDTVTITISADDVNDNSPECSPRTYTKTYREDFDWSTDAASDPVATIACSDSDSGSNDIASYTITTVNGVAAGTPFAIDGSGVITVNADFDYETTSFYSLVITVSDGGATVLSSTANVYVSITDVNEADPVFTSQPTTASVAETAAVGTSVTKVTATDADTDNTLTYTLASSNSYFHIDPLSGVVYLKKAVDYETATSYSIDVVATDDGSVDAVRSTTHTTLTISVTNVNDETPTFNPASYFVDVDEDEAIGTSITAVTATDDGSISYSITAGDTTPASFRITSGGDIEIDAGLDYETTPYYSLTVEASDGTNVGTTTVVINVNNINEHTPTYSSGSGPYTVSESEAADYTIGTVVFTDGDADAAGEIVYSISSGDTTHFSIDPATGVLKLLQPLDMEDTTSYNLLIHATDQATPQNTGN